MRSCDATHGTSAPTVADEHRVTSPAVQSEPIVALDGRPLGRRGAATRRRLLDATVELLASSGIRDLRVVDIARDVGTSPATFYQYFRDVEEAVLVLSEEVGEDLAPLRGLLVGSWDGPDGLDAARRFVEGFLEWWDAHRAVLRTRNLAAQEGDERFKAVRAKALRPVNEGLRQKVEAGQAAGRVSAALHPYVVASSLTSLLERIAAFHGEIEHAADVSRQNVVETVARMVHQTVTGREN